MNNFDTFDEYREASVSYQSNQRHMPLQSSQGGSVLQREPEAQRQRPYPKLQPGQKQAMPARMPKAQALVLLRKLKRGIVIASLLGFGTFSALSLGHTMGVTAQQASTTTVTHKTTTTVTTTPKKTITVTTTPKTTATTTPKATSTKTTTQQGGGYGFGSSTTTSTPVSGTHTS